MLLALPVILAAVLGQSSSPKPVRAEHELYGFLLRQGPEAFEKKLGKPLKTGVRDDGSPYAAYEIDKHSDNYLAVVFAELEGHQQAIAIELTGNEYTGQASFMGLQLGDDAKKVESVLGKPSEITHESDVNVDLWRYDSNNYSMEMTDKGKLYSIQIVDGTEAPQTALLVDQVAIFRKAVEQAKQKSYEALLEQLSGDVSCSDGKDYGLKAGAAADQISQPKDGLVLCLEKASRAMTPDVMAKISIDIRVYEKAPAGMVAKFSKESKLAEIVYRWEAHRWRVYEITLR